MTTTATPAAPSSLLAREPALVLSYTTGLLIWLLGFLTAHGVITGTQASVLTQAVAPVVAGLIVAGSGHLIRRYVSPALQATIVADVQKVEHELTPAQLASLEHAVAGVVGPLVARVEAALGVGGSAKVTVDTSATTTGSAPAATVTWTTPALTTSPAPAPAPKKAAAKAVKAPAKKTAPKK